MLDYELLKQYRDQETVHPERLEYRPILDRLVLMARLEPGQWLPVAYSNDNSVPKRLRRAAKKHPDFEWNWEIECFTRKMRPNRDGSPGYEIWARIEK